MLTIIEKQPFDGIGVGQYGTFRGALLFNDPYDNPTTRRATISFRSSRKRESSGFSLVALLFIVLFTKFTRVLPRLSRGEREHYLPFLIGAVTIFLNMCNRL